MTPVSGKVHKVLETRKSGEHTFSRTATTIIHTTFVLLERQVILELLAFSEVIREDGPVIMIKGILSEMRY